MRKIVSKPQLICPGKKIPAPTDVGRAAGFLEGVYRAQVVETGESVRVVRVSGGEAVCVHGKGLKSQTRLYDIDKITVPKPACPVCFKYTDPDGACPDVRRHEYDMLYAASKNVSLYNRKARRRLAALVVRAGRLLTS